MQKLSCLIFISILLSSCDRALDRIYNEKRLISDAQAIINEDELQDGDLIHLGRYIQFIRMNGTTNIHKTYRELFSESKKWKWFSGVEFSRGSAKDIMMDSLIEETSDLIEFEITDDKQYARIYLKFLNKGNKEVRSIEGILGFPRFMFDDLNSMIVKFDNGLKQGEETLGIITIPSNPFDLIHIKSGEHYRHSKYRWKTQKIIYNDKSIME